MRRVELSQRERGELAASAKNFAMSTHDRPTEETSEQQSDAALEKLTDTLVDVTNNMTTFYKFGELSKTQVFNLVVVFLRILRESYEDGRVISYAHGRAHPRLTVIYARLLKERFDGELDKLEAAVLERVDRGLS